MTLIDHGLTCAGICFMFIFVFCIIIVNLQIPYFSVVYYLNNLFLIF